MFIGHYGAALALASKFTKKGVLSYIMMFSVLPDIMMLGGGLFGSRLNFHADMGLIICVTLVLLIGYLSKFSLRITCLAMASLFIHLVMDLPYLSSDSSNWYAHPWLDFTIESLIFLLAAMFYQHSQKLDIRSFRMFYVIVTIVLLMQTYWNFSGDFKF